MHLCQISEESPTRTLIHASENPPRKIVYLVARYRYMLHAGSGCGPPIATDYNKGHQKS